MGELEVQLFHAHESNMYPSCITLTYIKEEATLGLALITRSFLVYLGMLN
jgi:hypothetical protein